MNNRPVALVILYGRYKGNYDHITKMFDAKHFGRNSPHLHESSIWLSLFLLTLLTLKIDKTIFWNQLPDPRVFWTQTQNIDSANQFVTNSLYSACSSNRPSTATVPIILREHKKLDQTIRRWNNILSSNDSKSIWKAINWNGEYCPMPDETTRPSDEEFCQYFTGLLNYTGPRPLIIPDTDMYIPQL